MHPGIVNFKVRRISIAAGLPAVLLISFCWPTETANSAIVGERTVWAQEFTDPLAESTWRRTRLGWKRTSSWDQPDPSRLAGRLEHVHPFSISAMVLLLSVGAMIWASDEKQWAAVVQGR